MRAKQIADTDQPAPGRVLAMTAIPRAPRATPSRGSHAAAAAGTRPKTLAVRNQIAAPRRKVPMPSQRRMVASDGAE